MQASTQAETRSEPAPEDVAWVLAQEPRPPEGVRLFCLPPAGGGAANYRKWAAALPAEVDIHRIQPPGRETRFREPFCKRPEDYVSTVARLVAAEPDRPYALFGHSMGALLAYEVAHQVRDQIGREPHHIFASAFRSPREERPPSIHQLPDPEFITQLRDRFGGVPDEVLKYPEVLEIMLPIVRADLALLSAYEYTARKPLRCPISAVGGRADPWVHEQDLRRWSALTTGPFAVHMVDGGHFYLDSALHELVGIVTRALLQSPQAAATG